MIQQVISFNPREHLMSIKNKGGATDYLPVQWRLVWFREQCPEGAIFTELVHMDLDKEVESEVMQWDNDKKRMVAVTKRGVGVAVFKATITDGQGGSSTGFGSEKASDFGDFLEKAETKAIGRALAALGFGTQFAPELDEGSRIVDAPVDQNDTSPRNQQEKIAQNQPRQLISAVKQSPSQVTDDQSVTPTIQELKSQLQEANLLNQEGALMTWEELMILAFAKDIANGYTLERIVKLGDTGKFKLERRQALMKLIVDLKAKQV
jgi:hypothetical protein